MKRTVFVLVAVVAATIGVIAAALPSAAGPHRPAASWSNAGSPKETVAQTSAVYLKGRVYVPGGWNEGFGTAFDKMQFLQTKTGKWMIDKETMPAGGMAQGAVCTDGTKVYVVNGISSAGSLLNSLQIYDPKKAPGSRWSMGPVPFTAKDGFLRSRDGGCGFIGKKLYLFGGEAQTSNGTIDDISGFTWTYNTSTGTWADTKRAMHTARWVFGYASDGSNLYVAGGLDPNGTYLQSAERFDPASGWSKMADLPNPEGGGTGYYWPGVGLLGGSLAVFGGGATGGSKGYQDRTLLCSLPCAPGATWINAHRNMIAGRSDFAAAFGGSTPTLYAVCGQGDVGFETTAEKTT
jgi:hypothetical protein